MNKINPLKFLTIATMLLFSFSIIYAQEGNGFDNPPYDAPNREKGLVKLLGLTQAQTQQIRQIRSEQVPLLRDAQKRQHEAKQNLDQAVYSDVIDEAAIQLLLKEFQTAQAEVAKIRLMNELAVRKVLTPEQLEKFRTIRRQFMQRMERPPNRNNRRRDQPPPGPNRGQKPPPPSF
jgi:Spy/CpxP family protein refolding chaperone